MAPPAPAAAGKRRAAALDLHDIADAIQNLPTDSSALLPSPAPFAQFFGSTVASEASTPASAAAPAVASTTASTASTYIPTTSAEDAPPTPGLLPATAKFSSLRLSASDEVYSRAVALTINTSARRMQRDIASGRYEPEQLAAAVAECKRLAGEEENGEDTIVGRKENVLQKLNEARAARNARSVDIVNATGITIDAETIQILAQSLDSIRSGGGSQPSPYVACKPGTVWSWTKYFKGVWGAPDRQVSSQTVLSDQFILRAQPVQSAQQQHQGQKRHNQEQVQPLPAPKRRMAPKKLFLGCSENDNGVHPQPLKLSVRSSSAENIGSQQRSQSIYPTSVVFDLISSIASCPDLILLVCRYLCLGDILVLYRVSRVFKNAFDGNLEVNVMRMARQFALPDTIAIFPWSLYTKATVTLRHPSVAARDQPPTRVPTLRYVGMLISRERKVRDIIACLARAGHRLPRMTAATTLKKMWLLMDIPTNHGRVDLLKSEAFFTDEDLVTIEMFHVKLVMHFHDPFLEPEPSPVAVAEAAVVNAAGPAGGGAAAGMIAGPMPVTTTAPAAGGFNDGGGDIQTWAAVAAAAAAAVMRHQQELPQHSLVETLLGQRGGFHVLWSLLRGKAYRTASDVVELKVRYDYVPPPSAQTTENVYLQGFPSGVELLEAIGGARAEALASTAATTAVGSALPFPLPPDLQAYLDPGLFDMSIDSSVDSGGGTSENSDVNSDANSSVGPIVAGAPSVPFNFGLDHGIDPSLNLNPSSTFDFTVSISPNDRDGTPNRTALAEAIHAVPVWEMGVGHLEGWGAGTQHLLRPDELVPLEAERRRRVHPDDHMDLSSHVPFLAVWGTRDFETGENLVPTVEEMYISDDEDEGKGQDKAGDFNGNRLVGSGLGENVFSATAAADMDHAFPTAEKRLARRCGNVPVQPDEWQPWQVLKAQWDTLSLQDKLDVWWMSHQGRLRRQAWTQRDSGENGGQISYAEAAAEDEGEDYGPEIDDNDNGEDEGEDETYSGFGVSENNPPLGSPPSTPRLDSQGPAAPYGDGDPSVLPDSARSLPVRHQNLMSSCIRWALREQDEADAALLAQSEMTYEEEELDHWEQFLATVGSSTEDDNSDDGNDHSDDGSDEGDAGSYLGGGSDFDDLALLPPNPEVVLAPEYGGEDDVLRLVGLLVQAEAAVAVAEAESEGEADADTAHRPNATNAQQAELVAGAQWLRRKLEAVLQGEVFAIEF